MADNTDQDLMVGHGAPATAGDGTHDVRRLILYSDVDTRVGAFLPHIHLYMPCAMAEQ